MKCGQSLLHAVEGWRHNLLAQHAPGGSLYIQQLLRSQLQSVLHAVIYWWLQQPGREMRRALMFNHIRRAL